VLGANCTTSKGHLDKDNMSNDTPDFKVEEGIIPVSLSKSLITTTRSKLPFLEDRDSFTLN
jgi:hypothetical protein